MREDNQEQLEKMFQDGYAICYTNPNMTIRLGFFNPKGLKSLDKLRVHIMDNDCFEADVY
jgi:hypothetical protein